MSPETGAEIARLKAKLAVYVLKSLLDISLNDARIVQALRSSRPVSKARLIAAGEMNVAARSGLNVRLHKLREPLRDVTAEADPIVNVWGQGWRLSLGARAVLDELIDAQIAA
jgi:DNA-binding winged helix-turn-helix (wHTH) protein